MENYQNLQFTVTVYGRGGHGSRPDLSRNPLYAFLGLHGLLRQWEPLDWEHPCRCTVEEALCGDRSNAFADSMFLSGCLRYCNDADVRLFQSRLPEMASAMANRFHCTAEVTFQ